MKKETKEKAKEFWKKNGNRIACATFVGGVTFFVGTKVYLAYKNISKYTSAQMKVDEELFTEIAPAIEDAIFDKGIDDFHHESTFFFDDAENIGKKLEVVVSKISK